MVRSLGSRCDYRFYGFFVLDRSILSNEVFSYACGKSLDGYARWLLRQGPCRCC